MTVTTKSGRRYRDREAYAEALREYHDRYGELIAACLSPSSARMRCRDDLVERYQAGRYDGTPWPSLKGVQGAFGSFSAARAAIGLPPFGAPRSAASRAADDAAGRDGGPEAPVQRDEDPGSAEQPQVLSPDVKASAQVDAALPELLGRVRAAERRAAVAEHELAETVRLVVGERRPLTREEMDALRRSGPAGPAVLADALKRLSAARARGGGDVREALVAVATAAMNWRDRL